MGRRSYKKSSKLSFSKVSMKKNNIYINNISLDEAFQIIDSENVEMAGVILKNIMILGVTLITMAQISISAQPESTEYVDSLPSYKDIKKKFVTGQPGRTAAACIGIATAYPYLMQDSEMKGEDCPGKVAQIIVDLVDSPSPNVKRIKPSTSDWQSFAKGEMGSALGQILSCPATNLKLLNIDGANVKDYTLEDAIVACGINKEVLLKYDINKEVILKETREIYLLSSTGIPLLSLEYPEPKQIGSKVQDEILSGLLVRTGSINTNLKKGLEPDSAITRSLVEKFLSKYELIAYNFALRSGDKNILKKYTDIVKQRAAK